MYRLLHRSFNTIKKCNSVLLSSGNNVDVINTRCYGKIIDGIEFMSKETSSETSTKTDKEASDKLEQYKEFVKLPFERNTGIINNILYANLHADLFQFREIKFQKEKTDKIMTDIDACNWSNDDIGIENLRKLGLFGACCIRKEYGGMELSLTEFLYILSHESILPYSQTLIQHQGLCALAIQSYGTEQQKLYYLPKMATGEIIGAYCAQEVNEPNESNSNPFKIICTAENPNYDEMSTSENNEILFDKKFNLSGKKSRVISAKYADMLVVLTRTVESIFEGARERTSLFIVDPQAPGVTMSSDKYAESSTNLADVEFDSVHLTEENLIGKVHTSEQILEILINSIGCQFSSILCGVARRMVREMSSKQNSFLSVKQSNRDLYAMESMLYYTSRMIDAQKNVGFMDFESDLVKHFCVERFSCIMERYRRFVEVDSSDFSLSSSWFWPLVSDIITWGTNGHDIKNQPNYVKSLRYRHIGQLVMQEIYGDIVILCHAIQKDGIRKTYQNRNAEKKIIKSANQVLPGAEPNTDGKFWFKKEAISILSLITRLRETAAQINRNLPQIKESDFLKDIYGNVFLNLYALFCVIARANSSKTELDKQLATEILQELATEIEVSWRFVEHIENNLHWFQVNAICQGIEREGGTYALRDLFDLRRNVYDDSPKKIKI